MDRWRWWRRWRSMEPLTRSGLLLGSLLALTGLAWAAGWAWLAVPAALAILGVAADAVGVDSRMPGDWRR
ncbi:MAG: hypothetical protein ACRDHU_05365 [Actinomycetota bacterium]